MIADQAPSPLSTYSITAIMKRVAADANRAAKVSFAQFHSSVSSSFEKKQFHSVGRVVSLMVFAAIMFVDVVGCVQSKIRVRGV